jgi:Flp pilus assembly protein TadD
MLTSANALYQSGKRREALAAYQAVLAHDPNASDALSKIAYIYLDKGDNARARRFSARAVELDPNSSEGWIVLGAALEGLGDRPGARNAYRTCASLGSDIYASECRRLGR